MAGYDGASRPAPHPARVREPPLRTRSPFLTPQFSPSLSFFLPSVGQVTYEQDVAWGEDGTGPSARGAGFSKQAARGRFFQLLQKQRRGGARSAGGGRVIGCV